MNLYVGNISRDASEDDLKSAFSAYEGVKSVKIIKDMNTHESKGFGFIEISNDADANKAISEMNGKNFKGRDLVVNEARPKTDTRSSGGGGGSRYGSSRR